MRLKPGVPVLALPDNGVRVGLHHYVDFPRLDAPQREWLMALEGSRAADSAPYSFLAHRLRTAGLIAEDDSTVSGPVSARVNAPRSVRAALESALRASGIRAGEDIAAFEPVDVEVLVSFGSPSLTAIDVLARDQPHLLVVTDDAGVSVGPFIRPGTTPCSTCLGLHAADGDAAWPYIAIQCDGRRARVDPHLVPEAAALIARAVRAGTAGHDPGVWRLAPDALTHHGTPHRHPECHCGSVLGDDLEDCEAVGFEFGGADSVDLGELAKGAGTVPGNLSHR